MYSTLHCSVQYCVNEVERRVREGMYVIQPLVCFTCLYIYLSIRVLSHQVDSLHTTTSFHNVKYFAENTQLREKEERGGGGETMEGQGRGTRTEGERRRGRAKNGLTRMTYTLTTHSTGLVLMVLEKTGGGSLDPSSGSGYTFSDPCEQTGERR